MSQVATLERPVDRIAPVAVAVDSPVTTRSVWKRVAFAVLAAMLVVELVLVAPYLDGAISALDRLELRWVAVAVIAELLSMGAFARVQRRMLAAGGARVPMRRMLALTYAANAVSVSLPGGTALSTAYAFKRLRSWGATVPAAGFTLLASGVLSTLSFAVLAIVCAALAGGGALSSIAVIAGSAIVAATVLVVRRHHRPDLLVRSASRVLARANRIMNRAPEAGLAALQRTIGELSAIKPRTRDWLAGFGYAEFNWIADLICLIACCYAVGGHGSTLLLAAVAYVAGTSAASISLLPGGLGVVDAAMIFAFTQGGISAVSAAAGVLLYRLISFAFVVGLGWLILAATWTRQHHRGVVVG